MAQQTADTTDCPKEKQESNEEAVNEQSIELDESELDRIRNLAKSLHSFDEVHQAVKRAICSKSFIEPWNVNYCTLELEKKAEELAAKIARESGATDNFTGDLPTNIRDSVEASDCMDLGNTNSSSQ